MKKSLLALSLAVAAGFVQANETTLYGRVTGVAGVVKDPDVKAVADLGGTVRFGIKGNEDLGADLKAIYQMEFDYNFANGNKGQFNEIRQANVGLTGGFGTLKLGKQGSLHGAYTGKADFSNSFGGSLNEGPGNRFAKAISYVSPDMSGFQVGVSTILDGSGVVIPNTVADSRSFRAYEVGAQYAANGLEVGGAYSQLDSLPGITPPKFYGVSVAYGVDNFHVAFDYEGSNDTGKDANYFALAGDYSITEKDRVYAGFELLDPKAYGVATEYYGHVGYQHNLSKRTRAWVEVGAKREKAQDFLKAKGGYAAAVGLRHDF